MLASVSRHYRVLDERCVVTVVGSLVGSLDVSCNCDAEVKGKLRKYKGTLSTVNNWNHGSFLHFSYLFN